jgi:hypothetical protein
MHRKLKSTIRNAGMVGGGEISLEKIFLENIHIDAEGKVI